MYYVRVEYFLNFRSGVTKDLVDEVITAEDRIEATEKASEKAKRYSRIRNNRVTFKITFLQRVKQDLKKSMEYNVDEIKQLFKEKDDEDLKGFLSEDEDRITVKKLYNERFDIINGNDQSEKSEPLDIN